VTLTEEFSALEQKSLNQIIATKIHKELSELRSRVDTSATRTETLGMGTDPDLEDPDAHVTFSHNGGALFVSSSSKSLRLFEKPDERQHGTAYDHGEVRDGISHDPSLVSLRHCDGCRQATRPVAKEVRALPRPERHGVGGDNRRRRGCKKLNPIRNTPSLSLIPKRRRAPSISFFEKPVDLRFRNLP
jgi:hypothetical protein